MNKKLYLSNSQINTFKDCSYKWYLERVERLRPTWTSSSLLFGLGIDSAVETMLKNVGKPDEEKEDYFDTFFEAMDISQIQINNTVYKDEEALLRINFSSGDIQPEILDEVALENFETTVSDLELDMDACLAKVEAKYKKKPKDLKKITDLGNPAVFFEYCKIRRRAKKALTLEEQWCYNSLAYESLMCKSQYILKALNEWVEENVAEVHEIQKKIEIENDEGDKFIGYLDFIVTLKDGRKVLVDLKTSSSITQYYPDGCVEDSRQLAIYAQECGLEHAAYLVIEKAIRKRDPKIRLSFIEGIITEEQLDKVFDEIAEVTMEIKEGCFEKNEDSCWNYGGCQYRNLCHNGSKKGLEKV